MRATTLWALALLCGAPSAALADQAGNEPPGLVDLGDAATHSGVTEGVERFAVECDKQKGKVGELLGDFRKASGKEGQGLNPADRKLQRGLLANMRLNNNLSKAARAAKWVLDKVNVVAVLARTAGRAAEGDMEGAGAVLADESLKRGAVSMGTAAGSYVPVVGSIAGALAAEEAHKHFVAPRIHKAADERRLANKKKELHGEKMTRRPQDDPPPLPGEPRPAPSAKVGEELLRHVSPLMVRALGKSVDDSSSGKAKGAVTTFSLQFFNLGALVPGYAKAILVTTYVSPLSGQTEKTSCAGRFSGGPDGTFSMRCEGEVIRFELVDGRHVQLDAESRLEVSNPEAFAGWPK